MTRAQKVWSWSAIAFVVVAAIVGALVERATHRIAARVESRFGWRPDRSAADDFVRSMGRDGVFATAAPAAMAVPAGQDVFLWRAADRASRAKYGKPFKVSNQAAVGSCVAHGAQHAVYLAESVAWAAGLRADAPLRPSTPSLYGGSRVEARGRPGDGRQPYGGWSDGSTGFHAAKWVRDWGVCYQQPYPAFGFDLTDGQHLEREWGAYGNGGKNDDGRFDAEAKKHPIQKVSRVETWDELVQAISSGMPVTIASNVGFQASARDADGFIARNGVWPHQMCIGAVRFAKNAPPGTKNPRDGACVFNSWDVTWPPQGGGKYPADQPDGTFWITRADTEIVLAAGDSWAYSTTANWEPVPLDNGEWFEPAPAADPVRPQPARVIAGTYSSLVSASMLIDRKTVIALVVGLGIGWWAATSPRSPVNPEPVPGRPVLSAFVRLTKTAARLGLWFALAAEKPPEQPRQQLVQHTYDAEGHPVVDHGEGW